ncbi:unnamed protein product [Didymodactylos carnosus]|nr:unnamed protein product [Didymodactylos carnosus]CAF4000526.1 unnamed protein product [Didymodactylos carnosus]
MLHSNIIGFQILYSSDEQTVVIGCEDGSLYSLTMASPSADEISFDFKLIVTAQSKHYSPRKPLLCRHFTLMNNQLLLNRIFYSPIVNPNEKFGYVSCVVHIWPHHQQQQSLNSLLEQFLGKTTVPLWKSYDELALILYYLPKHRDQANQILKRFISPSIISQSSFYSLQRLCRLQSLLESTSLALNKNRKSQQVASETKLLQKYLSQLNQLLVTLFGTSKKKLTKSELCLYNCVESLVDESLTKITFILTCPLCNGQINNDNLSLFTCTCVNNHCWPRCNRTFLPLQFDKAQCCSLCERTIISLDPLDNQYENFANESSYYCYDNPAGLQDVMKDDLKISSSTFTAFYSWYSWPNVVLAAVGGVLIDKYLGVAFGAVLFSAFIVLGQIVFGFGGYLRSIWLMNAGRFIFGIGGESLASAQNAYAVNWFFGKQLNFVFGLQISFARVGSLINLNTIRPIYDSLGGHLSGPKQIGTTLLIAVSTCIISLICGLILWWLDTRRRRAMVEDNEIVADVRHFPASLYCVFIICVFYYISVFPFIAAAQLLFESKYNLSPAWANACNSLVYFMSAILSPILGYLVDRTGRNIFWLIGSIAATIVSHIMLAFLFIHPVVPLVIMGIAYSILAASLWPMVAFLVPKQMLGTAYGLMQSIQNLGLAVMNIFTGLILDAYGYFLLEIFFIICLEVALLAAAFLYIWNSVKKGILNDSTAERKLKAAQEEQEKIAVETSVGTIKSVVLKPEVDHSNDQTINS